MNQHLGATYGLSVAIVIVFAIALYRPDEPPRPVATPATAGAPSRAIVPVTAAPERPVEVPKATTREAEVTAIDAPRRPEVVASPPRPRPASAVVRPVSQARRVEPSAGSGKRGFATARAGETIDDVARRVYGSSGAASRLWMANRDQVATPTTPLTEGMPLRTP